MAPCKEAIGRGCGLCQYKCSLHLNWFYALSSIICRVSKVFGKSIKWRQSVSSITGTAIHVPGMLPLTIDHRFAVCK